MTSPLHDKQILLIVGGGIAAYKTPELVRCLQKMGAKVRCVLTQAGAQFVTPMTLSALTGEAVQTELFDPQAQFSHIRLAREADVIVVAPATANLLAKCAQGLADDLASTLLLASDAPLLLAPAMNVAMWHNPATQDNLARLTHNGAHILQPDAGELACGEEGEGRLPPPQMIADAAARILAAKISLAGKRALVTAGPTHEPIDPVRYLANRSSGKQGYAIADALAGRGAEVTLISGPCAVAPPTGARLVKITTALEMRDATFAALPCDIAVMTAAVSDWRSAPAPQKIKKSHNQPPHLDLIENPDILAELCAHQQRPALVVGFAAETEKMLDHAKAKHRRKNCDWIVANDVSQDGVLGGDTTQLHLIRADAQPEPSQRGSKQEAAAWLTDRIVQHCASNPAA